MNFMKAYDCVGQWSWFAFGTWAGMAIPMVAETLFFDPPPPPHDLPVELTVIASIPLSLLMSAIFRVWIVIRSARSGSTAELPWTIPLVLGIVYFPICYGSIRLLVLLAEKGLGADTGDLFLGLSAPCLFFGLPVVLGEIAFRTGRRRKAANAAGQS